MNLIAKIFSYAHARGSHGIESAKWKRVENKLHARFCPGLFTMILRGIKKERF